MQKKNIIELSITGVLIFVLLFAIIKSAKRAEQTKRLKTKPARRDLQKDELSKKILSQKKISAEEPKVGGKGLFRRLEEETKDLRLKRDPFVPLPITSKDISPSGLHLSGIVWDKENPKVIINDIIVGIGDRVGGNTIVDIEQDKVILNDGSHYFEIRLGQ